MMSTNIKGNFKYRDKIKYFINIETVFIASIFQLTKKMSSEFNEMLVR